MPYFPILGFTPDADPTIPGTLRYTDGLLPSIRGVEGLPTGVDIDCSATLTDAITAAITLRQSDGQARTFAGTGLGLFEAAGTTWTDRSKSGGYTGNATTRWRFAQFGNNTYAVNRIDLPQLSTTAAFDDVSAMPKAAIVANIGNFNLGSFVFVFDTNESIYGDSPDRWWCSAIGDPADWSPAIATQCATGRLTSTPGRIKAAHPLGHDVIVFKERSVYRGRYTQPPIVWDFSDVISEEIGANSHEAVINTGDRLMWPSHDDFYQFNGVQLSRIPNNLHSWFYNESLDHDNIHKIVGAVDRWKGWVVWLYPSAAGTGSLDSYIAFNYKSSIPRWTSGTLAASFLFSYGKPGITWDDLGTLYATWDDLPAVQYDSAFWLPGGPRLAKVNNTSFVQTFEGTPGAASAILWDVGAANVIPRGGGDEGQSLVIDQVRPRFQKVPPQAALLHSTRENLGGTLVSGSVTAALTFNNFTVGKSAPWHSSRMDYSGSSELLGVYISGALDGDA